MEKLMTKEMETVFRCAMSNFLEKFDGESIDEYDNVPIRQKIKNYYCFLIAKNYSKIISGQMSIEEIVHEVDGMINGQVCTFYNDRKLFIYYFKALVTHTKEFESAKLYAILQMRMLEKLGEEND